MSYQGAVKRLRSELGELLETHDNARDLAAFWRYEDDPVGFMREVLGAEPWSKQIEIANTVLASPLVCVVGANSVGKDFTIGQLALWWAYARGGLVLVTAPTQRQVREVLFGEISRAWHRAKDLPGELYSQALRLPGSEGGILGFTSTAVSSLTGFHGPRILGVLSEAQGLEPMAFEAMLACATGSEDKILMVGNPLEPSGRFYEASRGDVWDSITIPAKEHPNIVEGRGVIPGGPSVEWVERMASEYGRGSNTYRSRVLSEFPDQGEEALFSRAMLDAAADKHESGEFAEEVAQAVPILAVDPARYGPDSTVAAIRRGPCIERLVEWKNASLTETADRVEALALESGLRRKYIANAIKQPPGTIVVDSVGLGAGVVDILYDKGFRTVAFNGGHYPRGERSKFLNARAQAFWNLRDALEQGRIALPRDDPKLFDELLAIQWRPTADGRVQIEAKAELRAKLGRSPDRADAVSMAFSEGVTGGICFAPLGLL